MLHKVVLEPALADLRNVPHASNQLTDRTRNSHSSGSPGTFSGSLSGTFSGFSTGTSNRTSVKALASAFGLVVAEGVSNILTVVVAKL